MTEATFDLTELQNSPLAEVVLAVGFDEFHQMLKPQLDELHQQKFKDRFPREELRAPFNAIVEAFDDESESGPIPSSSPLTNMRYWWMDIGGNELVQVQRNWLGRNWRSVGKGVINERIPDYPGYDKMLAEFDDTLEKFTEYVREADLGEFTPIQCEISYVCHVASGGIWKGPADLHNAMRLFSESKGDFLPDLEAMRTITQYVITEDGQPLGRLFGRIETALSPQNARPVLVLTLMARSRPIESVAEIHPFFDLGDKWITEGFHDFVTQRMLEEWN